MFNTIAKLAWVLLVLATLGCREPRDRALPGPVYDAEIAKLLRARCGDCHGDADAASSFRVDSYLGTLACSSEQPETQAVEAGDAGAPILEVLKRDDHDGLLDSEQEARLRDWVERGAPLRERTVHDPGILNPRSRDWHGRLAARDDFGPIKRASHVDACGRCHAGAPVQPEGVSHPAPGATACTSCHREKGGVLACGTCHGDGASRAYPPRDRCAFPTSLPDAHGAHVEGSERSALALACSACHPAAAALSGSHANGRLDIALSAELAGPDASYDAETGQCAVRCHDRGGSLPRPRFSDPGPLGCGSCHGAPPEDHYAGSCDDCHAGVNATGDALLDTRWHVNGTVDLRDGGSGCGACHGRGDDPLPRTSSHLLHRDTQLTREISCDECHPVPERVTSAGHLDRGARTPVDLSWGARATARGQAPRFQQGSCRDVACHGAGLAEALARAPVWNTEPSGECAGCHGLPPTREHPADSGCASLICHGAEVRVDGRSQPAITEAGRALHVNGSIDTTQRTPAQ